MRGLIQRVSEATVEVSGEAVGHIEQGLLLLLAVEKQDTAANVERLLDRVLSYRVFADAEQHMNLSLTDVGGALLVVSQFTLAADTRKGRRPSFSSAAPPELARRLYDSFIAESRDRCNTQAGQFGADMQVHLINDGPVTFLLEG